MTSTRPRAPREPERRRGAGARRRVVGPAGPEPGLRRGAGEGHHHRRRPSRRTSTCARPCRSTRRTDDSLLTFLVTARQDTAWGGFSRPRQRHLALAADGAATPTRTTRRRRFRTPRILLPANRGQWLRGPATLQNLPTIRLDLPSRALTEHLSWSFSADFTRLAPFQGHSGDEGVDGLYKINTYPDSPPLVLADLDSAEPCTEPRPGHPASTWTTSPRATALAGRRARGAAAARSGPAAHRELRGGRLAAHPPERVDPPGPLPRRGHPTTDQRGYAVGDVLVSSEISRTFDNGLRHAIQPSLAVPRDPRPVGRGPRLISRPVPISRSRIASTTRSTARSSRRRSARAWPGSARR